MFHKVGSFITGSIMSALGLMLMFENVDRPRDNENPPLDK